MSDSKKACLKASTDQAPSFCSGNIVQGSGSSPSDMAGIAQRFVENAGPLLIASRSLLITLTMKVDPTRPNNVRAYYWNGKGHLRALMPALRYMDRSLGRSLTAFEGAGSMLLDDLLQRWPVNACPPAIGIVTDGSGVAFSRDHPSPMHADWLTMHLGGRRKTIDLLPCSPDGYWARLIAPIKSQGIH